MSIPFYSDIDLNNNQINNVKAPTSNNDGANKKYVDDIVDSSIATAKANLEQTIQDLNTSLGNDISNLDTKINTLQSDIPNQIIETIADDLETFSATKSLSAYQGVVLATQIKNLAARVSASAVTYWDGQGSEKEAENLPMWREIIESALSAGVLIFSSSTDGVGYFVITPEQATTFTDETFSGTITLLGSIVNTTFVTDETGSYSRNSVIGVSLTFAEGTLTIVSDINNTYSLSSKYLPIDNAGVVFTPTADGHPANKKYVDDAIKNIPGIDPNKYLDKTNTGTEILQGRIQIGDHTTNTANALLHMRKVQTSITGKLVNGACFSVNQDGTASFQHKTYNNDGTGAKNASVLRFSNQGIQFAINSGSASTPTEDMYKELATQEYVDSIVGTIAQALDDINGTIV